MALRLQTELCRRFGIRYPMIVAGMAGGPSTPALAAAVSEAGGLGTLGAAYLEPSAIRAAVQAIRERTDAPFAVNLFVPQPSTPGGETARERLGDVQRHLNRIRDSLNVPRKPEDDYVSAPDRFEEQFAVLMEEKVPIVSTAFGVLPEAQMREAKSAGTLVAAMATTVQEALLAESAGCDAIVAQGGEAGGHRGTFDVRERRMGANVGTMALVPQIVDRVRVPVVAAGGIMDGRGLVAALALGAQGVQMGTRFLTAAEAGTHPAYREALLASDETSTELTRAFSGRPARGIRNEFMDRWEATGVEPLDFPIQNGMTRDVRNAAAAQNNPAFMSLWAGQGTRMLRSEQSARDIVAEIMRQAAALLTD
jgi:nitronate monooxygenase